MQDWEVGKSECSAVMAEIQVYTWHESVQTSNWSFIARESSRNQLNKERQMTELIIENNKVSKLPAIPVVYKSSDE